MALIDALIQLMIIVRFITPNMIPRVLTIGGVTQKAPINAAIANTIHSTNRIVPNLFIAFFYRKVTNRLTTIKSPAYHHQRGMQVLLTKVAILGFGGSCYYGQTCRFPILIFDTDREPIFTVTTFLFPILMALHIRYYHPCIRFQLICS